MGPCPAQSMYPQRKDPGCSGPDLSHRLYRSAADLQEISRNLMNPKEHLFIPSWCTALMERKVQSCSGSRATQVPGMTYDRPKPVGPCRHVHATPPQTYAGVLKRPESTVGLVKPTPEPVKPAPRPTLRLQKLTASGLNVLRNCVAQTPVPEPVTEAAPKSKKMEVLRALLAEPPALSVTCVMKPRDIPGPAQHHSIPSPDNSQLHRPCANQQIAFIMGFVCSASDSDDSDGWSSDSDSEPDDHPIPNARTDLSSVIKDDLKEMPGAVSSGTVSPGSPPAQHVVDANKRWTLAYGSIPLCSKVSIGKVRFASDLVSVHEAAEPHDRKGPWEELARDRWRFSQRVAATARFLDPILDFNHRRHVYEQRFAEPGIDPQIRETSNGVMDDLVVSTGSDNLLGLEPVSTA